MLRIIFWGVVIILLLSFFGISLQNLATSPVAQANFGFVGVVLLTAWNVFIAFVGSIINPVTAFINSLIYHKPIY